MDVQLDKLGFSGKTLMDDEAVDTSLSLKHGLVPRPDKDSQLLLLTNLRVIHLSRRGRRSEVSFASLKDVQAVDISISMRDYSALVWSILALIVGVLLWQVVNSTVASVILGIAMGLIALFFLGEFWLSAEKVTITFRAGSAQIRGHLGSRGASSRAYAFVNRFFQLRGSQDSAGQPTTEVTEESEVHPIRDDSGEEGVLSFRDD